MTFALQEQHGQIRTAAWARKVGRSALQEMLALATGSDSISFALGLPAGDMFPLEGMEEAAMGALRSGARALQYSPPLQTLKRQIVSLLHERGVSCREEQVFLTCGAQQGMNLLAQLLLDRGNGKALVEEMIYTGFQQVLGPLQPEIMAVQTDLETGMDVSSVEMLLAAGNRPSFIYTVTDGHNPLGVSMSESKRVRLIELARSYHVPIIEDDAYGFLQYADRPLHPLRALDENLVLYVGSFSKILAPALRVGWVLVPEELIPSLSIIKEASDIDTTTFAQRIVSAYLETGQQQEHLRKLRRAYRIRRDTMLRMLEEHFPVSCRWTKPTGGFFIWVELPPQLDAGELLKLAIVEEKITFIPGYVFSVYAAGGGRNTMRLNFSHSSAELITDGIARLGKLIKRMLAASD